MKVDRMQELFDNPYPTRYNITMDNLEDIDEVAAAIAKDLTTAVMVTGINTGGEHYIAYDYAHGAENIGGHYWVNKGHHAAGEGEIVIPLRDRRPWTGTNIREIIEAKEAGDENYEDAGVSSDPMPIQTILSEYADYHSDWDPDVLIDADTYGMDEDEIIAAAPRNAEAHIDDQSAHYWCTELWTANSLHDFDQEIKVIEIPNTK